MKQDWTPARGKEDTLQYTKEIGYRTFEVIGIRNLYHPRFLCPHPPFGVYIAQIDVHELITCLDYLVDSQIRHSYNFNGLQDLMEKYNDEDKSMRFIANALFQHWWWELSHGVFSGTKNQCEGYIQQYLDNH
jgi:hypothetical protein